MAKWHDYNPWKDSIVYVPVEELAEALADGRQISLQNGTTVEYTAEMMLEHWHEASYEIDAYILPRAHGYSVGIRYGSHGDQYLSPHVPDNDRIHDLFLRHSSIHPTAL